MSYRVWVDLRGVHLRSEDIYDKETALAVAEAFSRRLDAMSGVDEIEGQEVFEPKNRPVAARKK